MKRKTRAQPKRNPPPMLAVLMRYERVARSLENAAKQMSLMALGTLKRRNVKFLRICGAPIEGVLEAGDSPADLLSGALRLKCMAETLRTLVPETRAAYWEEQRKPKSKRARKIQPRKHARISVNTGRRK